MGEPLKSLSARARLGAALPAHYPGTPANFEDVSDESTLALSEVLSAISTEDAALVNQIRRFRGPWLLSRADDHVVLRNYDGENQAFGNSLTVLVLRDASGTAVYRFGVIKTVVAPPEGEAEPKEPPKKKSKSSKKPAAKKPSARKKR